MKLSANCKGGTKNFFHLPMIKSDSSYVKSKKKLISRKWKKEYYRLIDGIVRSYAVQRFFKGLFCLLCFIVTVILATLLYLQS